MPMSLRLKINEYSQIVPTVINNITIRVTVPINVILSTVKNEIIGRRDNNGKV